MVLHRPIKKSTIFVLILLAFVLAVGFAAGLFLRSSDYIIYPRIPPAQPTVPTSTQPPQPEPIDTSDWQTYRNEEYGFEFKYPPYFQGLQEDIALPGADILKYQGAVISREYRSCELNAARGISYCEASIDEDPRCEAMDRILIDWKDDESASAETTRGCETIILNIQWSEDAQKSEKDKFRQILSTFKFIE